MAEILKEMNITSVAFNRLWANLNTRILPNKVNVEEGKGLSTNDFTNELLAKLNGIEENANKYVHPTSGVNAGTYRSVTVDENGHITAGTNPDTLAGYGVTAVPADLLTGTISIDRLPHAALERCVVVANDEARFALTTDNAQTGDTVKVQDTNKDFKKTEMLSVTLNNVDTELQENREKIKILTENNKALTLKVDTLSKNIDNKNKEKYK